MGSLASFLLNIEVEPIPLVVEFNVFLEHEISEGLPHHGLLRLLVELEVTRLVDEVLELRGLPPAQFVHRGVDLGVPDPLLLLLLGGGVQPLPGEVAPEELEQHLAQALQVVPPALLLAEVVVDGGIAGSASQVLAVLEGDVLLGLVVEVTFGQPEVDQLDRVPAGAVAHEEVVGFGVTVDEVVLVDGLQAGQHLLSQEQHGLQRELLAALDGQVVE